MKKIVFLASFMGLFLLIASVAFGHGGTYSGPAGAGTASGFSPAGAGTPAARSGIICPSPGSIPRLRMMSNKNI